MALLNLSSLARVCGVVVRFASKATDCSAIKKKIDKEHTGSSMFSLQCVSFGSELLAKVLFLHRHARHHFD